MEESKQQPESVPEQQTFEGEFDPKTTPAAPKTKQEMRDLVKRVKQRVAKNRKTKQPTEGIHVIEGKLQLTPSGMQKYLQARPGGCSMHKEYFRVGEKLYYHKDTKFKPENDLQRRNRKEFVRARTIQRAFTELVDFKQLLLQVEEETKKKEKQAEMDSSVSEDLRDVPGTTMKKYF